MFKKSRQRLKSLERPPVCRRRNLGGVDLGVSSRRQAIALRVKIGVFQFGESNLDNLFRFPMKLSKIDILSTGVLLAQILIACQHPDPEHLLSVILSILKVMEILYSKEQ